MIEIGVVRLGDGSSAWVAEGLMAARLRAKVVAVCEPGADSQLGVADRFDVPPDARFDRWEDLFDRIRLDAVAVFAPVEEREPILVAAAKAGLHALSLAPLSDTEEGRRRVLDAARDSIVRLARLPSPPEGDPSDIASAVKAFADYLETGLGDYPAFDAP